MRTTVRSLVREVLHVAERSPGVRDVEPLLERLLAHLRSEPGAREAFAAEVSALVRPRGADLALGRPGVVELIEFCMHELRWDEVRDTVLAVAAASDDWRVTRAAERVLSAFEDDWGDGDIYRRYDTGG